MTREEERAARRRTLRRQRLAATATLVVVAVAAAAILGGLLDGGAGPAPTTARVTHLPPASAAHPRRARQPVTRTIPATAPGAHRAAHEHVPVLMYHVVASPKRGAFYPELWVSGEHFAAQMHALARYGYHGVTLGQVWDAWHRGGLLPGHPIVVSFDDGYHSQYASAMPVLRALRWPGVLNLAVHNIDPQDLSAHQIRTMLRAGWELASHTISHPDLTTLDADQLRHELVASRAQLRRRFGVAVDFFCYPSGRYDDAVVAAVRAAGYRGATTTDEGLAAPSDPFTLKRIRVNGTDDAGSVLARLAAAR